jgi:aspartate aminotransferase
MDSKFLAKRLELVNESATIAMSKMAREIASQGHDVISLSLGQPDFDTPDHVKQAAKDALDNGYTNYTPVAGHPEFVEAIINKFKRDNNLDFTKENINVTCGAKQCISNLMNALVDPGDEVIIFTPYWVSYFDIVTMVGGVPVCLKAGIENDFKVTPKQLEDAITDKSKVIIFSSPCNPTGSVYTKDELYALAKVIDEKHDLFVISDEIYEYINFGEKHTSIGSFDIMKDQVATVNGMAKGFAMTGWRIGYMGAPAWLAKACAAIQSQVTSGAASFSQKASAVAISSDMGPTEKMKVAFEKRKQIMISGLQNIEGIKTNNPQGAFYIFPDVSSFFGKSNGKVQINNSQDFAIELLKNAFVATVAGSAFGDDNCIRLSYAASEEELIEALRRMKEFLKEFN